MSKKMHYVSLLIFVGAFVVPLIASSTATPAQVAKGYVPPDGFVPDSATAVRIAVAVWIPIYGAAHIRAEQPYVAKLEHGVWTVMGTLPPLTLGGTAVARLAKRDGRILFVNHGQ
jgi:hypothetical protein